MFIRSDTRSMLQRLEDNQACRLNSTHSIVSGLRSILGSISIACRLTDVATVNAPDKMKQIVIKVRMGTFSQKMMAGCGERGRIDNGATWKVAQILWVLLSKKAVKTSI